MERLRENSKCPVDEIAAYIDGELEADREMELDAHFAACRSCAGELTLQKQFLSGLESGLKSGNDIDLPPDFTKHIVANAESTVSGLRRPRERFNAIFICTALMLFILFALGADVRRSLDGMAGAIDQATAVAGFFGHFVYAFFLGVAIVMRNFATQVRPEILAAFLISIAVVLFLAFLSQRVLSARRA